MNNYKMVLNVAKWEFNRWFKIKEQIYSVLISSLISLLIFGGGNILDKFSDNEINIVLINESELQLNFNDDSEIKINKKNIDEFESQKKLLVEEEIDGILYLKNIDDIKLTINKESKWIDIVNAEINSAKQKYKLNKSNISQNQLEDIFSPAKIDINFTGITKGKTTSGEKITAGVFIGIMLFGIFLGLSYQFVAITGEKQLRITEVISSAISPQTWIDGKILGISLLSFALLITYLISSLLFVYIGSLFGSNMSIPLAATNPLLIIKLLCFAIGGFLFWNTFFSAIAATINDPNTSARGSLIMLPVIPIALAFFAFSNPDSVLMKVLSIFPLTSAPVISARLVLTDVSYIEIILSIILLFLSIYYLRKFAGRIFSLSILMYGKEPSWKEISKWLKKI